MNKGVVNTSLPAGESKEKAEAILRKTGISLAYAYEWLYRQIIIHEGLPSDIAMPNETTIQAMEEARQGKGKTYNSVNELFKDCSTHSGNSLPGRIAIQKDIKI